jgi:hypothetical protein
MPARMTGLTSPAQTVRIADHGTPLPRLIHISGVSTKLPGRRTSHRFVERVLTLFGGWRFNPPVSLQPAGEAARHAVAGPNIWANLRLEIPHVVVKMGGAEGTRTPDPHTASVVRYQLRHSPLPGRRLRQAEK